MTHVWAEAFWNAGFDGVRYRLRHDPSAQLLGFAVFGAAGEASFPFRSSAIPGTLVRQAERHFGVRVLPERIS